MRTRRRFAFYAVFSAAAAVILLAAFSEIASIYHF